MVELLFPILRKQTIFPIRGRIAITIGGIGTLSSIGMLIFCILRFSKQEETLVKQINTLAPVNAVAQIPVPNIIRT